MSQEDLSNFASSPYKFISMVDDTTIYVSTHVSNATDLSLTPSLHVKNTFIVPSLHHNLLSIPLSYT